MSGEGREPSALSAHLSPSAVQPQEAAALENKPVARKQSLQHTLFSASIIPSSEQVPWHEWGFRFNL